LAQGFQCDVGRDDQILRIADRQGFVLNPFCQVGGIVVQDELIDGAGVVDAIGGSCPAAELPPALGMTCNCAEMAPAIDILQGLVAGPVHLLAEAEITLCGEPAHDYSCSVLEVDR
jgi:hypothetical protein